MSDIERRGHCLCGQVRFVARGEPVWVAHCHCESCRRATSAAFATYAGYRAAAVEWTDGPRAIHRSSPGVQRGFCPRCGSPMSFESVRWPDEIHLLLPSFEDPESLTPTRHVHADARIGWVGQVLAPQFNE